MFYQLGKMNKGKTFMISLIIKISYMNKFGLFFKADLNKIFK